MDQQLLFLINRQWTNAALDKVMAALSSFDAWSPVLLLLGIALLVRGGFRVRAFVVTAAAIVGINDGLVSTPLKYLVNRPRPHQAVSDVRQIDLAKATPRLLALGKPVTVKLSRVSIGEDFMKRYEAKFNLGRNAFAGYSYDAVLLVEAAAPAALKKAKPGTPEFRAALRDALENVKNVVGTHAVYTMTPANHNGMDERARVLVEVKDGQWRLMK